MKILKFGGASVKSPEGVKNLASIVSSIKGNHIIVISAMGKITNSLENLCNAYFHKTNDLNIILEDINLFHLNIIDSLFEKEAYIYTLYNKHFSRLKTKIGEEASLYFDYEYDQIVSFGEIFSTIITSEYLNSIGQENQWMDIRKSIKTDDRFREGKIDWNLSKELCRKNFNFESTSVYISQGFIAGTTTNQTTTLGREGSDFTAAILANTLDAEQVCIWKDVPGIMNADPKEYADTQIIKQLSYKECIELAHSGAKVIHPNTIKPLENKKIPLYVRSFIKPEESGSVVNDQKDISPLLPNYIHKHDQVLISLSPRDFSIIDSKELNEIFTLFVENNIKINLVQSSAISFSLCCDCKDSLLKTLIEKLKKDYYILYNKKTELITIRHFDQESIERATANKNILLEQRTRLSARYVVGNKE